MENNVVYIVNKELVSSEKENIEKCWNDNFSESLITKSLFYNIACFDNFENAKIFADQEIKELIKRHESDEIYVHICVKPIKVQNRFALGYITYEYFDKMYIIYFYIDELIVQ